MRSPASLPTGGGRLASRRTDRLQGRSFTSRACPSALAVACALELLAAVTMAAPRAQAAQTTQTTQAAQATQISQPAHPEASGALARAEALLATGRAEADVDRRSSAAKAFDEALKLFEGAGDREGRARVLTAMSGNLLLAHDAGGAERRAREAVELLRDGGSPVLLASAYRALAAAMTPSPSKAPLLAEALAAARAAGAREDECALLHIRATDDLNSSDYAAAATGADAALACYRRLPGEGRAGRVLLTLGSIDAMHGQYEKAVARFEESLVFHEAKQEPLSIATSLSALAQAQVALGREAEARPRMERALAIVRNLRAETATPVLTGIVGTFYVTTREFARATPLLEEALATSRNPRARVLFLINLAIAEMQQDRLAAARGWGDRAVEEARQFGSGAIVDALRWRAEARRRGGDLAGAASDLREGMALADEARAKSVPLDFMKRGFSEWHQELYTTSIALFMQTGDTRRALEAAEQARGRAFLDLLATRDSKDQPAAPTNLAQKAAIERDDAAARTDAAAARAASASPAGRSAESGPADASGVGKASRDPARAAAAAGGRAAGSNATAGDRSRGHAAPAGDASGAAPRDAVRGENASHDDAARVDAATRAGAGAAARSAEARGGIGGSVDGASGAALANDIAGTPPDLENSGRVGAPRVEDMVAAAARLRSTLVTYWAAPDELFVWVVTPRGDVHATRVPTPLRDLVRLARDARQPADAAAGGALTWLPSQRRPWRALYDTLIAPIDRHLPAQPDALLTIVPHGPLFQVSFAALIDPRGRYLLERYRLHYAPAVGVLAYTARQAEPRGNLARTRAGYRALLVGDPGELTIAGDSLAVPSASSRSSTDAKAKASANANANAAAPAAADARASASPSAATPLPALPWSRREVDAIAAQLGPARATVLVADRASEAEVRAQLADRDVLHFATHGIVSHDGLLSSYLALRGQSDGESSAATDGRLTADEVYGLDLRASLVVLSACGSALGPTMMGDGVIGFTRAFLYARAASVVATEWNVPDAIGYEVMRRFYRAWGAGSSVSGALRRAQLDTMAALRAGRIRVDTPGGGRVALAEHPVLWAAFIVAGEP